MIQEYIKCLFLIFVAEMGDKTQILALTFATKYNIKKVLIGVFIGAFLNHGIAVILGNSLSKVIDFKMMGIFAGVLFILFAFWTLRTDDGKESEVKYKYGAIITVAIAFFVGELGDKTQLTAITLASDSLHPIIVLAGTVSGMVLTSAIGIFVGMKLGRSIPETVMRIVSSLIFMIFGLNKLMASIPKSYINNFIFIVIITLIIVLYRINKLLTHNKLKTSKLKLEAEKVMKFYNTVQNKIENICLGTEICGDCEGKSCIIGYIKYLVNNEINNPGSIIDPSKIRLEMKDKIYNMGMVTECLVYVIYYLKTDNNNVIINIIRKNLEIILLNDSIEDFENTDKYLLNLNLINSENKDMLIESLGEKCKSK